MSLLLQNSRGPSTVTLIAFWYVVTCAGTVDMHMVSEKLLPVITIEIERRAHKRAYKLNKHEYEHECGCYRHV